jgi:hypothetical protein
MAAVLPTEQSEHPQPPPVPAEAVEPSSKQHLKVYLLKGDRDQILKVPLPQKELHTRMEAVLARSKKSTWDILMSLTAKDQSNVHHAIETTKQKDNTERILAAIEAEPSTENLRHILLFLTPQVENRPTWTRISLRHLSLEVLIGTE